MSKKENYISEEYLKSFLSSNKEELFVSVRTIISQRMKLEKIGIGKLNLYAKEDNTLNEILNNSLQESFDDFLGEIKQKIIKEGEGYELNTIEKQKLLWIIAIQYLNSMRHRKFYEKSVYNEKLNDFYMQDDIVIAEKLVEKLKKKSMYIIYNEHSPDEPLISAIFPAYIKLDDNEECRMYYFTLSPQIAIFCSEEMDNCNGDGIVSGYNYGKINAYNRMLIANAREIETELISGNKRYLDKLLKNSRK